jgi:hypothetical protein
MGRDREASMAEGKDGEFSTNSEGLKMAVRVMLYYER